MIVFVDYDNIPRIEQSRGITHSLTRILETIGAESLTGFPRVRFRLYGGWYEQQNLTRKAQDLAADMVIFPKTIQVVGRHSSVSPIVSVELARSLAAEPQTILENTFRRKSVPYGLLCEVPPYPSCVNSAACPVARVHEFINNKECPEAGCNLTPDMALHRREQKLVDGMLIADLIYFANASLGPLAVVTSDDDIWVGIKSALLLGSKIHHVHTIPGRITAYRYKRGAGPNYLESSL